MLRIMTLMPRAQFIELFDKFPPGVAMLVSVLVLAGGVLAIAQIIARAQSKKIVSNAEVEKIRAESERDEQKTQADLNRQIGSLALQLTQERGESNRQMFELMGQLSDYRAKNAEVIGEYTAYKLAQVTIVENLQSQLRITEEAWHQTREANRRLERQLDEQGQQIRDLQTQGANLESALNAANAISEQRKNENEQLRHINAGLEEENAGLLQRIEELQAEIRTLRSEKEALEERVARLEREAQQKADSEPAATPPVLVSEAHEGD